MQEEDDNDSFGFRKFQQLQLLLRSGLFFCCPDSRTGHCHCSGSVHLRFVPSFYWNLER